MKRMKFLFGQRRMQVLLTLAVLLLAVSVVIGSGASFTSTSANPANTFTAGTLSHSNTKAGAILTAGPLSPGQTSAPGTVTITNTGDVQANFTLKRTNLVDTLGKNVVALPALAAGEGANPLSETLMLNIVDDAATPNVIYNGKLDAFPAAGVPAGTFNGGAAVTYTFKVTFPDTDGAGPNGADNKYKRSKSVCEFDWEAVSN